MNQDDRFALSEAAKRAQREYKKKWRAANPDKVKESNRRYWERRARLQAEMEADTDENDS